MGLTRHAMPWITEAAMLDKACHDTGTRNATIWAGQGIFTRLSMSSSTCIARNIKCNGHDKGFLKDA
ncbi:hypothetical protein C5H24_10805 [Xylella fastidiosa]|nr:hypothetical protein C5H24_10805 [Xylella fastidiosa]TNW18408.1 hypothetical protein C5H12_11075 [Xylella fastidiosa]